MQIADKVAKRSLEKETEREREGRERAKEPERRFVFACQE